MAMSSPPSASSDETPSSNDMAAYFPGDALWDPSWVPAAGEATIQRRMAAPSPVLVTLYSSWFCPFAQRAWIALEETGTNYLYQEINPYSVDPEEPGGYTKQALSLEEKSRLYPGFVAASPRGLVPAVRFDGHAVVWESLPVVEYVDSVFGTGSLVPDEPHARAMVQIWSAHCTDRIQKAYYAALMSQTEEEKHQALDQYFIECRALANAMRDDGPYFLGSRFSMVDVALAPFWQRMIWVGGHYLGLQFPDDKEFRRLQKWWEATSARPSVAETMVCKERLISSYSQYDRGIATSDFAKTFQT